MAMKYLVSLLMALSALFVEAQTYEKIKAAVPSEKYKEYEEVMHEILGDVELPGQGLLYKLMMDGLADSYYKTAYDCLSKYLNNCTESKINKVVGEWLNSKEFLAHYVSAMTVIYTFCSNNPDTKSSTKVEKIHLLVLQQSWKDWQGNAGPYQVYLTKVIEAATSKSSGASL